MRRRLAGPGAFMIVELLVVIGIIAILLSILLPTMEKVRHHAYIDSCASNLRQIGQSLAMYANDHNGAYPRATYDPATANLGVVMGNNANSPSFSSGSLVPNDVTEAIYLLLK